MDEVITLMRRSAEALTLAVEAAIGPDTSRLCDTGQHEACRVRWCTCACHARIGVMDRTAQPRRDDDGTWSPYPRGEGVPGVPSPVDVEAAMVRGGA